MKVGMIEINRTHSKATMILKVVVVVFVIVIAAISGKMQSRV